MKSDEVKAAKTAKTQAVANYIAECLQPFAVTSSASSSSDQIQLIADLQAQLEADYAKNKAPSPPAMNQPPAKRMRLCSKTATVSHAPLEHPSERRERLSQALLQILTEGSTGSQGSPSSSSLVSNLHNNRHRPGRCVWNSCSSGSYFC